LSFFSRYRKFIAAVVTLVVLVALMGLTARERETVLLLEKAFLEALAPFQAWLGNLSAGIRTGIADLQAVGRLRAENIELRAKADAYDATVHRLRELEIENERLRALLGFAERVGYESVAAEVVARSPDNWFSRLVVDRGSADGVAKDMPVVTGQGLVGRVIAVSAHVSVVQLLTDRECGVGGLVQSTRDAGIVSGQGSQSPLLSMMLFERDAVVGPGDAVVTSGYGSIYPPGLYIGEVVEVKKDTYGLVKYALIRPGVVFGRLEEVIILTNAAPSTTVPTTQTAPVGGVGGGGP